ncbi:hypothetical protein OG806_08250 [Streptomyces sp. NBC_00882]|uniref:hypothetical protein n=1 Tax=Streptomyces sp. NBC_00882 TaxID=2975856 RepID=UPI0038670617|nr:hypothetical protein OG806_08250 [Streptomyces sp. NBC_00882]
MKKIRAWLVLALLGALAIRVLWWAVEPLVPLLAGALVVLVVIGALYHRASRW